MLAVRLARIRGRSSRLRPFILLALCACASLRPQTSSAQAPRAQGRSTQGGPTFEWLPEDTIGLVRSRGADALFPRDDTSRFPTCFEEFERTLSATYTLVPRDGPRAYPVAFGSFTRERVETCIETILTASGAAARVSRDGPITSFETAAATFRIGFGDGRLVVADRTHIDALLVSRPRRGRVAIDRLLPLLDSSEEWSAHSLDVALEYFGISCPGFVARDRDHTAWLTCESNERANALLQQINRLRSTLAPEGPGTRMLVSAALSVEGSNVVVRTDAAGLEALHSLVATAYTHQVEWMMQFATRPRVPPPAPPPTDSGPRLPTRAEVGATLGALARPVAACFAGSSETGVIDATIRFVRSGAVEAVALEGLPPDSAGARCVRERLLTARLPIELSREFTVSYPFRY